MSLLQLLILISAALAVCLAGTFKSTTKLRLPLMLVFSVVAIFWLQPALPIRGLDFWLPVGTLLLVLASWELTAAPEERGLRSNLRPLLIIIGVVLAMGLTRLLGVKGILTPSRPPQLWLIGIALVLLAGLYLFTARIKSVSRILLTSAVAGLILLFVVLKFPALTQVVSSALRSLSGQSAFTGLCARHPLAGIFLRGLPPDPHPARPSERTPAGRDA